MKNITYDGFQLYPVTWEVQIYPLVPLTLEKLKLNILKIEVVSF